MPSIDKLPSWARRDDIDPPSDVVAAAATFGQGILSGKVSKHQVRSATGLSGTQTEALFRWLKGGLSRPAPASRATETEDLHYSKNWVYNSESDSIVTFIKASPKPIVLPMWKHSAIVKAYSNWDGDPATINEVCRRFSFPRPWLVEYLRAHNITHDREPFSQRDLLERDPDELVEEALEGRRQVLFEKFERRKWSETKQESEAYRALMNGVVDPVISRLEGSTAKSPALRLSQHQRSADRRFALVTHATDFHWGMRSHAGSRHLYNRAEATRLLTKHTDEILSRMPGTPDHIFVGVGGDWMHFDDHAYRTTKGTQMDPACTWEEMFATGAELAVKHIEALATVAPVTVVVIPGNHARRSDFVLGVTVDFYFRSNPRVQVQYTSDDRVYTEYGRTLMLWHHGDTLKGKSLGALMPSEEPAAWARCPSRIAIRGHHHHAYMMNQDGVTEYQFQSLAGLDQFHSKHGWTHTYQGLDALVVERDGGVSAMLISEELSDLWQGRLGGVE